jgi:4-hydroxybenzoate polyprenyltransferase
VLFCLLSGAVYLINDLADNEKDRIHPRKRLRPIASGEISLVFARRAAVLLCLVALAGGLLLGPWFVLAAAGYFALNLGYSFHIKHMIFFDVVSIAAGFLLRVVAGALAVQVPPSPWLLVCTAVLACFLGFGKRAHELTSSGERAGTQRSVLARYQLQHLELALRALGILTVIVYVAYTQSPHTVEFFGTRGMAFTSPFIVAGVLRFLHLCKSRPGAESPTEEMLRDRVFLANLLLWVAAVTFVIYVAR